MTIFKFVCLSDHVSSWSIWFVSWNQIYTRIVKFLDDKFFQNKHGPPLIYIAK